KPRWQRLDLARAQIGLPRLLVVPVETSTRKLVGSLARYFTASGEPTRRDGDRGDTDAGGSHQATVNHGCGITSYGVHDGAKHDAALVGAVITGATVHRGQLIPHQHVADTPVMVENEAILRGVFGKFLDQWPGFLARHAEETMRMHWIDEQDLAPALRVHNHRRPLHFLRHLLGLCLVYAIQFFGRRSGASAMPRHNSCEAVLHGGRESVVSGTHIGEHGTAR